MGAFMMFGRLRLTTIAVGMAVSLVGSPVLAETRATDGTTPTSIGERLQTGARGVGGMVVGALGVTAGAPTAVVGALFINLALKTTRFPAVAVPTLAVGIGLFAVGGSLYGSSADMFLRGNASLQSAWRGNNIPRNDASDCRGRPCSEIRPNERSASGVGTTR